MNFKKKIKNQNFEKKYCKLKNLFIISQILILLLFIIIGTSIYYNYDYLAFKYLIANKYVYTDTLDELFSNELKQDINKKYLTYFDDVVISIVTKEIRNLNTDKYTYLYLPTEYADYKSRTKDKSESNTYFQIDDSTIYVRLTNFSDYTTTYMKDIKDEIKIYDNLILDLRDNYGGTVKCLNFISDMFLSKGDIISTDISRGIFKSKPTKSKKNPVFDFNQIVILQNENSASSSEGLITALNDNLDSVTLMGTKSYGKGIGQMTIDLKKGFAVKATTMYWNTPNDINIQGKGIEPDIIYEADDITEYAAKYLKSLEK